MRLGGGEESRYLDVHGLLVGL